MRQFLPAHKGQPVGLPMLRIGGVSLPPNSMKILMTVSHGAGWGSWAENDAVAEFVMKYQPIIDYIEQKWKERDVKVYYPYPQDWHGLDGNHPLVLQLVAEVKERFKEYFYAGGATNLVVKDLTMPSFREIIGLTQHDGLESLGII